jgi:periplasmic protein TonB
MNIIKKMTVCAGLVLAASTMVAVPTAMAADGALVAKKRVAPVYPRGAERRKIEGHVVVTYSVDTEGKVSNVAVAEAVPEGVFDDAALKAVSKWKYEPPTSAVSGARAKISFKL